VATKPGIKRSLASKWVVDKIKLTMPYPSARHLTLTDTLVAVADKQTADGYGIFDLTLSTTHFNL
jgi:hypothetical protein